ncbi:MAG: hypothetical protein JRI23_24810 [Deltaproteobacteria bacterium]|jgi:hypothetical protein|nr:hypothetical protein [Deltaproteobacteria bacterium]MBW2535234.1 hypothetical protein [Deltaproteobacteria bacterium]
MAEQMSVDQKQALQKDLTIVQRLLAISGVDKHETRFEGEVALVASSKVKKEVDDLVAQVMPAPVKPPDGPMSPEFAADGLLEAMGGVRGGQTLYVKELSGGLLWYVAYWPWGSGARFTIKIGVYEKGVVGS